MKMLLIISDGLGDVQDSELQNKTPLEYGTFSNLNKMCKEGICGMMDPIAPGTIPGSDTAHISILGEDPYTYYNGRGYLEALGTGLRPGPNDVGFRLNFGTVTDGIIEDRRAGRSSFGLKRLVKDINDSVKLDVPYQFKEATGTRAALVLEGDNLSNKVSDGDPHNIFEKPKKVVALDGSPEAERTASIINDFITKSQKVLEGHPVNEERKANGQLPVNFLLVRGAGLRPRYPTFQERYGVSAACIAATALIRGVAKCYGFDLIDIEGMTGEYNTDIKAKTKATLEALHKYDFVFTHFKPTDTASHDGDPQKKIQMIGYVDYLVSMIMKHQDRDDIVVAFTGDHTTPCSVGNHTGESVPIMMWGGRVRRDEVNHFDEISCAKGGLGHIRGQDVVPMLMNQALKNKLFGA